MTSYNKYVQIRNYRETAITQSSQEDEHKGLITNTSRIIAIIFMTTPVNLGVPVNLHYKVHSQKTVAVTVRCVG